MRLRLNFHSKIQNKCKTKMKNNKRSEFSLELKERRSLLWLLFKFYFKNIFLIYLNAKRNSRLCLEFKCDLQKWY